MVDAGRARTSPAPRERNGPFYVNRCQPSNCPEDGIADLLTDVSENDWRGVMMRIDHPQDRLEGIRSPW